MALLIRRLLVRTGLFLLVVAIVLMVAAGNPAWGAGWAFVIELGVLSLALGLWLAWRDPDLLAERLTLVGRESQPAWDRRFLIGVIAAFFFWLALMAVDAERLRFSTVPPFVHGLGVLLIGFSVWVGWRTFAANSFAAPSVSLQPGQSVATTGPYAVVRHPLYAGALGFFIGAPLMLGSWLGLIVSPFLVVAVGLRAVAEERFLTAQLPGYADYAARVRYRFLPGLW